MTPFAGEHDEIRQYLLGHLSEEARRRVEERLLTEGGFLEELLSGEDELIDDFVAGDLPGDDRLSFERHFLCTPERHRKLRFALVLNRYVSKASGKVARKSAEAKPFGPTARPSWAERLRAFWGGSPWALPAAALALVAVFAATVWLARPPTPRTFVALTLNAGAGDRSEGAQAARVTLPLNAEALRVSLTLPERTAAAQRYRVELMKDSGEAKNLEVDGQDAQSVSVLIPATQLARGQYILRIYAVGAGSTEQRVPGSYYLTVE